MKIKNRDLFSLAQSLAALSAYKLAPDDAGKTRIVLSRNLRLAREAVADLQEARIGLINDHKAEVVRDREGNEVVSTLSAEGRAYAKAWENLMDTESELDLGKVDYAKLKADEAGISVDVLAGLLPILNDGGN